MLRLRGAPYLLTVGAIVLLAACSGEKEAAGPAAAPTPASPTGVAPSEPPASASPQTAQPPGTPAAPGEAPATTASQGGPAATPAPGAAAAPGAVVLAGVTGDPAAGARVFRQCSSCHAVVPGENKVGPSLHGIIGRQAGTVPEFRYSKANQASDLTWSEETLFAFLENPREYMPGTLMSYAGLKNPKQRADVIAYLKTQS
jgi:cytochrome c